MNSMFSKGLRISWSFFLCLFFFATEQSSSDAELAVAFVNEGKSDS